jgi:antagonist of KipI
MERERWGAGVMEGITILKPGLLTTIQDKGRIGYQQFGMPVAGAMDELSMRLANILVGNDEFEACIEATMLGPEIQFDREAVIAVTGGAVTPKINGTDTVMWRSLKINKGDILSFGALRSGCRYYIAAAGGFSVPEVMGSKSTYIRGGIGGYEGRALKKGDKISLSGLSTNSSLIGRTIPQSEILSYCKEYTIRVILGPQEDHFTKESVDTFLSSEYSITKDADRMGYRLSGPKLEHTNGADIISDGIALGAIQVPGHGMPIIMMADRQTTGGYPKIATVISTDINILGQAKPGDKLRFMAVSIEEAHSILQEYESSIRDIKNQILESESKTKDVKKYKITINDRSYHVTIEELL